MPHDPVETWRKMRVRIWPEDYFLADLPHSEAALALRVLETSGARFCSVTRDQFCFSIVVDQATHDSLGLADKVQTCFGPLRVLSTDSDLPFDVPGFIRTALEPINALKLKAAPICGLQSDHFFTGAEQIDAVAELFETFCGGVIRA